MKLYQVMTPEGPQFRHRKDVAKKEDPHFTEVEIKTDLHSLMEHFNLLMRCPAVVISRDVVSVPSLEPGHIIYQPKPEAPEITYRPTMPPHAARNEAQTAWEEFILDIPEKEAYRLDTMQAVLDVRKKELGA